MLQPLAHQVQADQARQSARWLTRAERAA
jgi:hypothetical protein